MKETNITADNTIFVLLSFEGLDSYSLAGGLGVRVANLSQTLAHAGFLTHLFFIGDPKLRGEQTINRRLILHRWCQWISEYYPKGVYHGENEKLYDFNESIPSFVAEHLIKPGVAAGKLVVILGEEWQTAEAMCGLSDLLRSKGLRDKVVMFWNANNTYGFDRVDWQRLDQATTITTVSRYMKHIMWSMGLNPLVIPNGIPKHLLGKVDDRRVGAVKAALRADVILCKVARWHPDKRWHEAVEATARLNEVGLRTVLVARGGIESYGHEVGEKARSLGLRVREASTKFGSFDSHLGALREAAPADVIDVKFHLPPDSSRVLYRAADGVLVNSGHEPFGLVGLEAMAAGGIAYTGCTGEDYAIPFVNSFVLETADPQEIMGYVVYLREVPEEGEKMRKAARRTAHQFTWESAVQNLIGKLRNQARAQGILAGRAKPASLPLFEIEDRPDTESQQCQETPNRAQNSEQEAKRCCQCIGGSPRAGEASLSRRMSGAARSVYAAERQTIVAREGDGGGGDVDNAQKVSAMQR